MVIRYRPRVWNEDAKAYIKGNYQSLLILGQRKAQKRMRDQLTNFTALPLRFGAEDATIVAFLNNQQVELLYK